MPFPHLGESRAARRSDHLLQTPDTFVRTPLPGITGGVAVVHCATALGANFAQYTLEIDRGGSLAATEMQRFVYVLEGELQIGSEQLGSGNYAYLPEREQQAIGALDNSRAAVIEKRYVARARVAEPKFLKRAEAEVEAQALANDPAVMVRSLLPGDDTFDFAVNSMTYLPGASLSQVEIHVMEHGLLMLEGEGIYRLNDSWYSVAKGDFIWMAPYCPQWFGALGKVPAKYLIYKDWNRHPL